MQPEEIIQAYAQRKHRQKLVTIGSLPILILVGLLGSFVLEGLIWVQLLLFLLLAGAMGLFSWRNWRCPACDRSLSTGKEYPHCPHCGARLIP